MRVRSVLSRHGAPIAIAMLPSVVWLAPILRDPAHAILGFEGDNLYYVRQFWWMKRALVDLHRSPFFDPDSYVPLGYAMIRGELTPANTIPALPITAIAGPLVAYNVMVAASFLFTTLATYAWVYRLWGSRAGALTAAVIATMAPFRLAHASGHLPLIATQGLPLALWAVEELLRARPGPMRMRWATALGLALAFAALSSWYHAYAAALIVPLYIVLRSATRSDLWRAPGWWGALTTAGVVAMSVVLPFALPYIAASSSGTLQRAFAETESLALNFYDFLMPNPRHPLWRDLFPSERQQWVERSVSIGYAALALAILALVWRRREQPAGRLAIAAVAVVSAAIAVGPLLHAWDRLVLLPAPDVVSKAVDWVFHRVRPYSPYRELFWSQQVVPVPTPSLLLFVFLPGAAGMRSFGRFGYWTVLMIAALAGFAVRDVCRRIRGAGRGRIALAIVLSAIVFESWTAIYVGRWTPRPVDLWIASEPSKEVVVELPVRHALRAAQDYYETIQQKASILGPRGDSFPSPDLMARMGVLSRMPSRESFEALRGWGTTLLIIQRDSISDWPIWEAALVAAHATETARFGETVVYRLR